ncbi:MAG: ABC transporter ATP-binding protein, partial [Ktedonobacteraceae bacterium]|nr:ABC transporter ATP-binding protein [Ktedonobacteraceae bacterium]
MSTLRDAWHLARYRAPLFFFSGSLNGILFYFFPLFPGLIVRQIFDGLSHNAPAALNLWGLVALLVGIELARALIFLCGITAETTLFRTVEALLRRNLFASILRRPGARSLPASTGEAVSRLRDDVVEVGGFVAWLFDPIGQILVLVAALIILLRISPLITLSVFIPFLAVLSVINFLRRRVRDYRSASQGAIADTTGLLGEVFGAVQMIKIARAEERIVQHFRRLSEARRRAALRDKVLTQLLNALSSNAADFGIGLLLLLAAQALQHKDFSVGDFTLFVFYLDWLTAVISSTGIVFAR